MIKKTKKKSLLADRAKEKASKMGGGFTDTVLNLPDNVKAFKLKDAKTILIDILPFKAGAGNKNASKGEYWYETTYWAHRGIGAESDSYVCPKKMRGLPCPIDEYRATLTAEDGDEQLIKDLAPKQRQLFNIRNLKDKEAGVQVWDISFHLFGKLLAKRLDDSDEDDGYERFAEIEGGFTLKCGVEEKSFGSFKFYEVVSIDFKPRREDYDEDILDEVHCLDELLKIESYKTLQSKLLETDGGGTGKDEEEEEEEEEEEKPKKKGKAKKPEPEPEEDEDEDEDEDWG